MLTLKVISSCKTPHPIYTEKDCPKRSTASSGLQLDLPEGGMSKFNAGISLTGGRLCPFTKTFNGLPVYRQPSQLGLNGAPRSKFAPTITHSNGLRFYDFNEKGYLVMCTEDGCRNTGSNMDIKCRKHADSFSKCKVDGCKRRPIYGYQENKPLRCAKQPQVVRPTGQR